MCMCRPLKQRRHCGRRTAVTRWRHEKRQERNRNLNPRRPRASESGMRADASNQPLLKARRPGLLVLSEARAGLISAVQRPSVRVTGWESAPGLAARMSASSAPGRQWAGGRLPGCACGACIPPPRRSTSECHLAALLATRRLSGSRCQRRGTLSAPSLGLQVGRGRAEPDCPPSDALPVRGPVWPCRVTVKVRATRICSIT